MSAINQEIWDIVVENSPYVHVSYELYYSEGNIDLYEDLDKTVVIETVWQPNLYAKALGTWRNNPYRYFMLYSALYAEKDNIGAFTYQDMDLDMDYYNLETTGMDIETLEDLVDFLNTHIPERVLKENNIKLVETEESTE